MSKSVDASEPRGETEPEPTIRDATPWLRRIAREGSLGRRLFDLALLSGIVGSLVLSSVNAAGSAPAPASAGGASGALPDALRPVSYGPLGNGLAAATDHTPGLDYNLAVWDGQQAAVWTLAQARPAGAPAITAGPAGMLATFGCDVPAGHYCAFTMFRGDGTRQSFGLNGGQRASIRIVPNVDRYIVAVDSAAPSALTQCAAIQAQGHFCKTAAAKAGFNN